MAQNAIVPIHTNTPAMPSQSEWSLMMDMAKSLVPTGFLPETIKKPEQAVAIMLKGRELGVPPMYALSNIVIVKGKPTVSAEMMLALIYRDHGKRAIRVSESTNDHCTIEYRLDGWSDVTSYTFSIDDAQKAGLAGSNTWRQYPAAMLRARCISAVARMAFPESIAGMYVPGELGEAVTVTDDGEVSSVPNADTGEIREPAPVTALPAPSDPAYAMRRLHAVARNAGITHEQLHGWAEAKGRDSLKDVPAEALDHIASMIDRDHEEARAYFAKYLPQPAPEPHPADDFEVMEDEAESLDAEQPALYDDPDLNAAADRIQRAEWARQ